MILLGPAKVRALRETTAWLVGRRRRIRVEGDSMLPTLAAGQFVLVDESSKPMQGQIVLANHPLQPDLLIIKRVGDVVSDGTFYLVSDNADAGTDSRTWGPVPASDVLGTVTLLLDEPAADLGP